MIRSDNYPPPLDSLNSGACDALDGPVLMSFHCVGTIKVSCSYLIPTQSPCSHRSYNHCRTQTGSDDQARVLPRPLALRSCNYCTSENNIVEHLSNIENYLLYH